MKGSLLWDSIGKYGLGICSARTPPGLSTRKIFVKRLLPGILRNVLEDIRQNRSSEIFVWIGDTIRPARADRRAFIRYRFLIQNWVDPRPAQPGLLGDLVDETAALAPDVEAVPPGCGQVVPD
jgi:hypothetical protein